MFRLLDVIVCIRLSCFLTPFSPLLAFYQAFGSSASIPFELSHTGSSHWLGALCMSWVTQILLMLHVPAACFGVVLLPLIALGLPLQCNTRITHLPQDLSLRGPRVKHIRQALAGLDSGFSPSPLGHGMCNVGQQHAYLLPDSWRSQSLPR